jgi:plastocyanin
MSDRSVSCRPRLPGSGILFLAALAVGCTTDPAAPPEDLSGPPVGTGAIAAQPTPLSATMQFGLADAGSPFPPAAGHDQSAHAKDNIVPGTVVIDQGGTVTFDVPSGAHQIAIYGPGTEPEDIDTGVLVTLCPGSATRLINDTQNRVALITSPCGSAWQAQYTFDTPGRYLVICAFLPHFQVGMYGWVEVREPVPVQ